MRCSAPANAGRRFSSLILGGHKLRCKGLAIARFATLRLGVEKLGLGSVFC